MIETTMKRFSKDDGNFLDTKRPRFGGAQSLTSGSKEINQGFCVKNASFNKKFPFFRQPMEIGSFSIDAERRFTDGRERLRKYKEPGSRNVQFNLRDGYKIFEARDETKKEYINYILRWVLLHKDRFKANQARNNAVTSSIDTQERCD